VFSLSNFQLAFTWPPGLGSNLPTGPQLVDELKRMIRSARYSIDLYFYNINSSNQFLLARELNSAISEREIPVRLFCDSRTEARRMLDTFRTSRSKISAWYWDDPEHSMSKFHIKSIVVDGRKLYIGSANLSETAMKFSAECGVFVVDPNASKQIHSYSELLINSGLLKAIR
jgi:phosphatidylserine/phosphatidylglycerophosphate/cardiolipin synthase-like enzyme